MSATSARPSAGRLAVPAKMTSSIFWQRTVLGRLGAEHPADGVDDVGLAAAVGPDHDRDPRLELERGRVGEGLEALEGERLQEHGRVDPSGAVAALGEWSLGGANAPLFLVALSAALRSAPARYARQSVLRAPGGAVRRPSLHLAAARRRRSMRPLDFAAHDRAPAAAARLALAGVDLVLRLEVADSPNRSRYCSSASDEPRCLIASCSVSTIAR